jgi:hypothetical protein
VYNRSVKGRKQAFAFARPDRVSTAIFNGLQSITSNIPLIVTSKTREEVKPDLEQAERLGIWVVVREDFDQIINRTSLFPNADRLYEETEASIRAAQGKYQLQQVPSLSQ